MLCFGCVLYVFCISFCVAVIVLWLFIEVPLVSLWSVIVAFPGLVRFLFMDFFSVFTVMFDNFVWICNSISTGSLNPLGFK